LRAPCMMRINTTASSPTLPNKRVLMAQTRIERRSRARSSLSLRVFS
jgi:hypothetical protein